MGLFTNNGQFQWQLCTNGGLASTYNPAGTVASINTCPTAGGLYVSGLTGMGTSTPYAQLSVSESSSLTRPFFVVASTTGSTNQEVFKIDQWGHHVINAGAAPAVSSCGTNPTISGDDVHGTVTVGSGVVTACTVTFNNAYTATPKWIGIETNSVLSSGVTSKSTTAFTVGFSATLGSGTFDYHVIQ